MNTASLPQIFTLLPHCGLSGPATDGGGAAGRTQVPDNQIYEAHVPGWRGSPETTRAADVTDKGHSQKEVGGPGWGHSVGWSIIP